MKLRRVLSLVLACAFVAGAAPAFADAPAIKRLTIQAPAKELVAGKEELSTMQLLAKAEPGDADLSGLVWSSKKPQVASVDEDGFVTALSGGSVSVAVTDTLTNKKASKTIKVWELPSGVDIRLSEKTLRAGRSVTLSAKLAPSSNIRKEDKALSWFSSDTSVASVNAKGKVTAVSSGEAVITVMTVNGRTDTCVITVTE